MVHPGVQYHLYLHPSPRVVLSPTQPTQPSSDSEQSRMTHAGDASPVYTINIPVRHAKAVENGPVGDAAAAFKAKATDKKKESGLA